MKKVNHLVIFILSMNMLFFNISVMENKIIDDKQVLYSRLDVQGKKKADIFAHACRVHDLEKISTFLDEHHSWANLILDGDYSSGSDHNYGRLEMPIFFELINNNCLQNNEFVLPNENTVLLALQNFIAKGATLNRRDGCNYSMVDHVVCFKNGLRILRLLLDSGADVNDDSYRSPLSLALITQNEDAAMMLYYRGASTDNLTVENNNLLSTYKNK